MGIRAAVYCCFIGTLPLPCIAQPLLTQSVTTSAAESEQAQLCQGGAYPTPADWDPSMALNEPLDATSGTPAIDQYRNGQKIATYHSFANGPGCDYTGASIDNPAPAAASGCGPFTYKYSVELKRDYDIFKVHPAVYSDTETDEIYMGPVYGGVAASHITIQGIVANNRRPVLLLTSGPGDQTLNQSVVYVDHSVGFTMENINIAAGPGGSVAYNAGAVFDAGGTDFTMRNMSIHGFGVTPQNPLGGNGLLTGGPGGASGFIKLERVELNANGGPGTSGNRHNAYISEGVTAIFDHVWSHAASYGHEIKSRAEATTVTNSYLEGVTGTPDYQGEAYLMDYSNGGQLTFVGNILRKGYSGPNSNGVSLYYAAEGVPDQRKLSVDIENNTFQALAQTFDGTHPLYPLAFFYPNQVPGTPGFGVLPAATTIQNNVFAGYCPAGVPALDYRGLSVTAALSEVNLDYTLAPTAQYSGASTAIVGTTPYQHITRAGAPRSLPTVGAMD
jgi:hypothetical protein